MKIDARGLALTILGYVIWGLSPLFWKQLLFVPPGQLLAHRIIWAAILLAMLLAAQRRWCEVRAALSSPRVLATLLVTTVLIASNWLTYIWAVVTERILQASLGYYMNPLVTVLLALAVLGERLNRPQWISVALATAGVAVLIWHQGELPWIALVLAVSFALYGLLRKQVRAEAEVGLLLEAGLLSPLLLIYLLRLESLGQGTFGHRGLAVDLMLIASGLITAVPLALFTHGARRLPLSTVGFLQFLAPTLQFLIAVFIYDEPFGSTQFVAFACIWAALAIFTWDLSRRWRDARPLAPPGSSP